MSPACRGHSCLFKGSRSGLWLPADCGISSLFCFASSVTKALSRDHPVYPLAWRGPARGRKLRVCGTSQQKEASRRIGYTKVAL